MVDIGPVSDACAAFPSTGGALATGAELEDITSIFENGRRFFDDAAPASSAQTRFTGGSQKSAASLWPRVHHNHVVALVSTRAAALVITIIDESARWFCMNNNPHLG